jgi:hypothetical protein
MKKILHVMLVALIAGASHAQCSDLFFSEYIEGSSSNKAIEIYNPTSTIIDLSDYTVNLYFNGSSTVGNSLTLSGNLNPGEVYVITNSSADSIIAAQSDITSNVTLFNGDDALELFKISTASTIDVIGEIGTDPGSSWAVGTGSTQNFTLVRSSNIQGGTSVWTVGQNQWDVFPIDMFDSLGVHTMIPCGAPCTNTSATISATECDTYTAPDGATYTTSGVYTATIANTQGCDSVITINLTINNSTTHNITKLACDSYTLNGTTYNFTGVYTQTLSNAAGCDSIITLDLSITETPNVVVNGILDYCEGDTPSALTIQGAGVSDSLIISGVLDATLPGGLPKVIEFYALEDISDLSAYGFGSANNGGGSDGEEFTFPAVSITAGTYFHVATDSANFFSFLGFYPDFIGGSAANINGDDALELFHNGAVIDVFGDINVDGTGQPWEYTNGWAYRKDNAVPNGGVFDIGQWDFSAPDALNGEPTNAGAAVPFPAETYIYTAPTYTFEWYSASFALLSSTDTYTPTITSGTEDYIPQIINVGDTSCANSSLVTVSFNALPSVTASASATTVCEGDSVTLTGSGANTYQWNNGVSDNVPFVATISSDYIVTGTDTIGCSAADTVTITVNPAPSVSLSALPTVCETDAAFTLSGGTPAGGTYSGTGVSNGDFDPSVAGAGTLTITYEYTDATTGCSASTTADLIVQDCAGLNEEANIGVVVYPNPASDEINVMSDIAIAAIQILDLSGVQVAKTASKNISVAHLASGMYVMHITTEQGTITKTFVKK